MGYDPPGQETLIAMTTSHPPTPNCGPLSGLRILDLSRILAAPTATQFLGDLGADIIKIERPNAGDDTRKWGPPFVKDADGNLTSESAYYLCANRNKRSVAIDISQPDGARLIRDMLKHCDILIENFKVGGLAKYGLSYNDLKDEFPDLIYCSVTGYGQTGPESYKPGYDYLAQGMGGMMSLTGEPDGEPMKVAVGIADVMCGMYASNAILAALHYRHSTGKGQYIDIGLADSQVAWLVNEGTNYLLSGEVPKRRGNAHPNIVPYQPLPTSDGFFILAVGNDTQFSKFCAFAGVPELAADQRFSTNTQRVHNREILIPLLEDTTRNKPMAYWLDGLSPIGVPCGPVNTLDKVFADPQFVHRGMKLTMDYPTAGTGKVDLVANPLKLSETPVSYRYPPPTLGQHTSEVLEDLLGLDEQDLNTLEENGLIGK